MKKLTLEELEAANKIAAAEMERQIDIGMSVWLVHDLDNGGSFFIDRITHERVDDPEKRFPPRSQ